MKIGNVKEESLEAKVKEVIISDDAIKLMLESEQVQKINLFYEDGQQDWPEFRNDLVNNKDIWFWGKIMKVYLWKIPLRSAIKGEIIVKGQRKYAIFSLGNSDGSVGYWDVKKLF
jgi:hypothetical protein